MLNIEQTIVELGTIFQQLAHMVKEQEELVQRYELILKFSSGFVSRCFIYVGWMMGTLSGWED